MIPLMGSIGQFHPLAGLGIIAIRPGHIATHVTVDDSTSNIKQSIDFHHPCGTATAIFRDLIPPAPLVLARIIDQNAFQADLVRKPSGHSTQDVNLALKTHRLKMMNLLRRLGSLPPGHRCWIEDGNCLNPATTQQEQLPFVFHECRFMSRLRLARHFQGFPRILRRNRNG